MITARWRGRLIPATKISERPLAVTARSTWLWEFVSPTVTVYDIAVGPGARGFDTAKQILGEDFSCVLCRDGWARAGTPSSAVDGRARSPDDGGRQGRFGRGVRRSPAWRTG